MQMSQTDPVLHLDRGEDRIAHKQKGPPKPKLGRAKSRKKWVSHIAFYGEVDGSDFSAILR
jgi:hypothetical protein